MLVKLENILEIVNGKGFQCSSLHIMGGYRTPYYNKAIGNVKNIRHIYDDASDIFIDVNPQDAMMDVFNKDGIIDQKDAVIIYNMIDNMPDGTGFKAYNGGLAKYEKNAVR